MLDKLEAIKARFEEVGQLIVQPDAMADMKQFSRLSKEYKDLEKLVGKYLEYKKAIDGIRDAKYMLETEKDSDFREMAKMELDGRSAENMPSVGSPSSYRYRGISGIRKLKKRHRRHANHAACENSSR